jgi:hypothetical protein
MFITKTSMISGQENTIWVAGLTANMLKEWKDGELAQEAFRGIPQELREFIMTGITPDEWNKTFSEGDEEDMEWSEQDEPYFSEEEIQTAAKKFIEILEDDKSFQN